MSLLRAAIGAAGEELALLAGRLQTRLLAAALPRRQIARGTATLSSVDGLTLTLAAGTFGATGVGDVVQALSGPQVGSEAAIASVTSPTEVVLSAPGLGAAVTSISWEVVALADTTLSVESTLNWPSSGEFYLGRKLHQFTGKTITSLTGVTHWDGETWLPGVARQHEINEVITDHSRVYSALDRVRRSFFVRTAVGEDLSVLGANHGRPRREGLGSDTIYRAYLRASMWGARGTRLHLREVLDALVGSGNWEIFEHFARAEDFAQVFIRRTDVLNTQLSGRAFLDGEVLAPATSGTTVTAPETPLMVGGVRYADETGLRIVAEGAAATSPDGLVFTVAGTTLPTGLRRGDVFEIMEGPASGRGRVLSRDSGTQLSLAGGEGFADAGLAATVAAKWRILREGTDCRYAIPSADTAPRYPADPGTQAWAWAGAETELNGASVVSGASGRFTRVGSVTGAADGYYQHLAQVLPDSDGQFSAVIAPDLGAVLSNTNGLQWGLEVRDGARALTAGLFYVDGSDVEVALVDGAGTALHSRYRFDGGEFRQITIEKTGQGVVRLFVDGRLAGEALHTSFAAAAQHELRFGCLSTTDDATAQVRQVNWHFTHGADYWCARAAAATLAGTPSTNVAGLGGMLQVGDVGSILRLSSGTARNAGGGTANGLWEVAAFVDANTATLAGSTHTGAEFRRGFPTSIFLPSDHALSFPDALGHQLEILTGPHAGTYPIAELHGPDGDLALRDDATAFDSALTSAGNDAAVRGYATEVIVSGGPAGGFTASDGQYNWRLIPVFPAGTGLLAELSDAGTLAGANLTLRQALPLAPGGGFTPVLSLNYSTVLSGHVHSHAANDIPVGNLWPFYLSDEWGSFRRIILDALAEGIDCDLDSLFRDASGIHLET